VPDPPGLARVAWTSRHFTKWLIRVLQQEDGDLMMEEQDLGVLPARHVDCQLRRRGCRGDTQGTNAIEGER
jgi:hypothetical protein